MSVLPLFALVIGVFTAMACFHPTVFNSVADSMPSCASKVSPIEAICDLAKGMVPDAIVVHAVESEKAADILLSTLGNQIHLTRSYRLFRNPAKMGISPAERTVWLQFGKNVKWNSDLR